MALQRHDGISLKDAGLSRRTMSIDGCLYSAGGLALTTTGTTEQVLKNITLYRNLISLNARGLRLRIYGNTVNNGNNKQIRVRLGANTITGQLWYDSGAVALNNGTFFAEMGMNRTGANTFDLLSWGLMGSTVVAPVYATVTLAGLDQLAAISINAITASLAGDATLIGYRLTFLTPGGVQSASGVLE
jgi:hypothetical protein